jgi:class 3 adenylate cyclase
MLLWFDDARATIETSLCLQESFARVNTDGVPLWVRIGVHWGRPRHRGDDIIGRDVNLASRIADLAGPGEVLCSEDAAQAAETGAPLRAVRFEPLGPIFVKGIAAPIAVFRVVRAGE